MADASYARGNFLGGEWSKAAQGRFDRPDYTTALNVCLNGIPLDTGSWTRRPGTMNGGTTRNGKQGREISLNFRESAPYKMEFTDGYLRFRIGKNLAMTNDQQAIVSISSANPAKVKTGVHGWTGSIQVQFNSLGTNNPLLQNRTFAGTVTSTTEFTLSDPITGSTIDGSTLGSFVSGNVSRILEIVTPYQTDAWKSLRSVQAEERAVLLTSTAAPQLLSVTTEPEDGANGFAAFSFDTANFVDGPYLDPPTNGVQVTPTALTGIVQVTLAFPSYDSAKAYSTGDFVTSSSVNYKSLIDQNVGNTPASSPTKWASVAAAAAIGPNGFVGTDIGRHIRMFSEPPLWAVGQSYTNTTSIVKYNKAYYTCLSSHTSSLLNAPGISLTQWGVNPLGAVWTWGKITGLLNQISQSLSGVANIGDMTENGGLAAAFDGVINQTQSACAATSATTSANNIHKVFYAGRNFASASDQVIGSVTIFPSTNTGFGSIGTNGGGATYTGYIFNLRGKSTLPSSSSDGTLLGTVNVLNALTSPATIVSNDQTTAWKYVWIEGIADVQGFGATTLVTTTVCVAELQMFAPPGAGSGSAINVEILGPALLYTTSIATWRMGLYSGTIGWPTCGCYHEGRLWLSGSIKNRFDASKPLNSTSNIFNFAPTDADGTVTNASAIDYTLRSPGVNSIFWMESDHQGILIGTQAGKWLVQASANNNILTTLSIQAHPVPSNGCANAEPARSGLTLAVIHRYKHKVMEYFADIFSGKFASKDLSKMAKHLATRGIERIVFQEELTPTIWAQCSDGSLIGSSYKRESLMSSQEPNFIGWHRTVLGSGRKIEGECVGPSSDGLLDSLSLVTNDTNAGIRHVEVLSNIWEEGSDITTAWQLDNAITPSFTAEETVGGALGLRLYGLWHLNGKTVSVFAGGLDCGDVAVSNGAAFVPYSLTGGLFTSGFVSSFTSGIAVVVGFTYNSDGQIVRPISPQESGARNGPAMGKKRRTEQYSVLLQDAQGISFGTDFAVARLKPALFKTPGGNAYAANTLFSGTHYDSLVDDYSFDSMLCWRISRPYPATVCAVSGYLQTQDR